ncbi:MAG TPA: hypothetical protein VNU45_02690 [Rummeliibacillus sp.]|nr:hypothetical protein [Rummeliibacillus sp.]
MPFVNGYFPEGLSNKEIKKVSNINEKWMVDITYIHTLRGVHVDYLYNDKKPGYLHFTA